MNEREGGGRQQSPGAALLAVGLVFVFGVITGFLLCRLA
jgi:hypothetical protein